VSQLVEALAREVPQRNGFDERKAFICKRFTIAFNGYANESKHPLDEIQYGTFFGQIIRHNICLIMQHTCRLHCTSLNLLACSAYINLVNPKNS
jgi:hypothetical protein